MNWYGIAGFSLASLPLVLIFLAIIKEFGWRKAFSWLSILFFILAWAFFVTYFLKRAGY